jgi:SLT domain-containing protein
MLLLKLTDGIIDIHGMEYRYITQLSTSIPPGTKVVLRGPIHYRLGTLLLTGDHVTVLGGNVDQYVVENDQQRVLARELNREDLIEERQSELENHHSNQDPPINTQPSQEEIILLPINRILSQPDIWNHHPIVYVKATFRRFNGDLRFIEGVWSMNATIADGTGEIPVLLGNAPLEVIIGCSARDFERINRGEGERVSDN